ncbi:MAG: TetR/AcrR family transcriptional regulator [Desulfuromonadales bacterium]|nr:TetR/AcrR family transcriptional regulator [Desulfuromonadales bacterium]
MTRRETLLDAAIALFAEKGYNGTSTSEIVEKAGVAQGTLFYHFKNKEGMLLTILENILNEYLQDMEEVASVTQSGLMTVENLIRCSTHFRQTRSLELLVLMRDFPADLIKPDSPQMMFIIEFFKRFYDLFKNAIDRGQKDGSIRKISSEKYTHILLGMLSGMDRHILLGPLPTPALTEEIVSFCCSALSPPGIDPVSHERRS